MERDYKQFPDDDNGAVLWRLRSLGDALTEPREIDFSVALPSEDVALEFAVTCLRSGFKVELVEVDEPQEGGLDWEVFVYTEAVPTHSDITMLEDTLTKEAESLGGRFSGWSTTPLEST